MKNLPRNTVIASTKGKDITRIYNGSLIRIYNGSNVMQGGGNDIYMLVSDPRPDGGTAGLMLIMLTTGACYNLKPMEAVFESMLYVTIDTFTKHVAGNRWEFVKSVTITREDV